MIFEDNGVKKLRWGRISGLLFLILIFAAGAYALRLYGQTKKALNGTYQAAGESKSAAVFQQKKAFSVLLLGADTGAEGRTDQGNSDTMIVATVNPSSKKVLLTSVPRDTMAELIGTSGFNVQKINAAYREGGSEMALNTVSKLLNVPLDYYVTINMGGLEKIVDAVGGVDVDVPFTFSYGGTTFTKGAMHLNGTQSLAYARMRYDDPENDYGRQKRQRQIITAIIKSTASTGTLANFQKVLKAITSNMKTNLTFDDMVQIFLNYRSASESISSDYIHGTAANIGAASYQIASTTELQRISDKIRQTQGLSTVTLNNEETRQNRLNVTNQGFIFENPTVEQNFVIYAQNNDYAAWNGN
ncbi:LCP family glycopolymer transferase [Lapidilactobacillus luobeiensis]|uniref:LCP family glycopolymer transferase n=1 Tax=Lapidilactobacillus luobeiensis TaxID=2950371 RepID=UPI0028527546|nr:LCP family protein [Lapidilactobacillus luobeiensis]